MMPKVGDRIENCSYCKFGTVIESNFTTAELVVKWDSGEITNESWESWWIDFPLA